MTESMFSLFLWVKSLHIIAVVTWFAAMFYLPRLFVYHANTTDDKTIATFKIMERRLYKGIANPSVAVVFICGFLMLYLQPALLKQGWMHTKLLLVFSLLAYHIICGRYLKTFAKDANKKSHKFYRWFNEYPTIILLAVVLLTIIRPW